MYYWSKGSKPRKRRRKGKILSTSVSFKKCDGGLKQAAPSLTPESHQPNVSTCFGSSNANPAMRHKWSRQRQGKHKWTVGGSRRRKKRKKSKHPNPSPQRVQNQTVKNQEAPQKDPTHPLQRSLASVCCDTQPASGLDVTSCQWLWYGAYIGNETRNIEFKQGTGNYMEMVFGCHIRKYGCAFLNSGGGTLLVGVHDSGMVCGVYFNHKREDDVRLLVDCTIQQFHPPLLPHNYSLRFLPVITPGVEGQHLKVVCLTFTAPPVFTQPTLYHINQGQVYIRRDGSVQGPVGAPFIIEWFTQMWAGKVQQLEQSLNAMMHERSLLSGQVQALHQTIAASSLQSESRISASSRQKRKKKEDQESPSTSQHIPSTSWNYRASSPDPSSDSRTCSDSST